MLVTHSSFCLCIKKTAPSGFYLNRCPVSEHLSFTQAVSHLSKEPLVFTFANRPRCQASNTTLARMPASHKSQSSMRVQRGLTQSGSSAQNPPRASAKTSEVERLIDRYLGQDRDYKSHVSANYDPHQEAARKKHENQLRDVIDAVERLGF